MEKRSYWLGRKRRSMSMARHATSSRARLVHYQLAGLYSLKAAVGDAPFLFARKEPASPCEAALIVR